MKYSSLIIFVNSTYSVSFILFIVIEELIIIIIIADAKFRIIFIKIILIDFLVIIIAK